MKGIVNSTDSYNIQEVALADAVLADFNQRDFKNEDQAIGELADNIKNVGLIHPPTVRKVGDDYQVICGARRVQALKKLKWQCAPMNVVECSDEEALALNAFENFERIDLTLQQEAQSIKQMIDAGVSTVQIAASTGKSREWVARRANLSNLHADVWAACEDDKHPIRGASEEVLEEVAKLQHDIQPEFIKAFYYHITDLPSVKKEIARLLRSLKVAKWDKAIAIDTPVGQMPACEGCPNRSDANADLFASNKIKTGDALCQNSRCYAAKMLSVNVKRFTDLKAKHGVCFWVNAEYGDVPKSHPAHKQTISLFDLSNVARSKKGAKVPGILISDSPHRGFIDGDLLWFDDPRKGDVHHTKQKAQRAANANVEGKEKKKAPTLAQLKTQLKEAEEKHAARWKLAEFNALQVEFIKLKGKPFHISDPQMFRLATVYRSETPRMLWNKKMSNEPRIEYPCEKTSKADAVALLWVSLHADINRFLSARVKADASYEGRAALTNFLYWLTNAKVTQIAKQVDADVPLPKKVTKLRAQIDAMSKKGSKVKS